MAVKVVNDTSEPRGLMPTLLVFEAYPKINKNSPRTISHVHRAEAVRNAMTKFWSMSNQRKVRNALNIRNGSNITNVLHGSLPIGSKVRIYREGQQWTGPSEVINLTNKDVTVEMDNGLATFCNTHMRKYNRHPDGNTIWHQHDCNAENIVEKNDLSDPPSTAVVLWAQSQPQSQAQISWK